MRTFALAFVLLPLQAVSHAAGKPPAPEKDPPELTVRRTFQGLSDKARVSLRQLTDQCLEKVARLPKATKVEWCKAEAGKMAFSRRRGGGYEAVLQQYNYQLERCSETADRRANDGLSKEQRIERCKEDLKRQIESIKGASAREEESLRKEAELCENLPGAKLEQKCRVFEDAYRNMIDRQLSF